MKRFIEKRQRLFRLLRHMRRDESERLKIEAVGIEAPRTRSRRALDFGPLQSWLEEANDLVGDPILEVKNVLERPIELVCPQSGPSFGIQEAAP